MGETTNLNWWVYRISEPSTVAQSWREILFIFKVSYFGKFGDYNMYNCSKKLGGIPYGPNHGSFNWNWHIGPELLRNILPGFFWSLSAPIVGHQHFTKRETPGFLSWLILLMEEIRHHLGCKKPCKWWDELPINWCRISSYMCIYI